MECGTAHRCDGSLLSDVGIFPLDNVSRGGRQDLDMPWARQALSSLFPAFVLSSNQGSSRGRAGVGLICFLGSGHPTAGAGCCRVQLPAAWRCSQLPASASGAHACMAGRRFHAGRVLHRSWRISLAGQGIPCHCFPSLLLFSFPQLGILWSTCTVHGPGQPSQLWSGGPVSHPGSQRDV